MAIYLANCSEVPLSAAIAARSPNPRSRTPFLSKRGFPQKGVSPPLLLFLFLPPLPSALSLLAPPHPKSLGACSFPFAALARPLFRAERGERVAGGQTGGVCGAGCGGGGGRVPAVGAGGRT
eukprot:188854-Rhodomonas_salina.1